MNAKFCEVARNPPRQSGDPYPGISICAAAAPDIAKNPERRTIALFGISRGPRRDLSAVSVEARKLLMAMLSTDILGFHTRYPAIISCTFVPANACQCQRIKST